MVQMVKSATQTGRSYSVEMIGLEATGCVCASRRYRSGVVCRHMLEAEEIAREEAITWVEAELDALVAEVGALSMTDDLAAAGYFEAMFPLPVRAGVVRVVA